MSRLKMFADDVALTLIDYRPATFHGVQSHDRKTISDNVQIVARTAKLFGIPTVLSTIAKDTFSGPFMPEVTDAIFSGEPVYERTSIIAWINADDRGAIEATRRKRIIVGGLWTCACINFPALDMLGAGHKVFFVIDACGDTSLEAHDHAVQRLMRAGAVQLTALQLVFELQQDWAQQETYEGIMDILGGFSASGTQVRFPNWALGEHAAEAVRARVAAE